MKKNAITNFLIVLMAIAFPFLGSAANPTNPDQPEDVLTLNLVLETDLSCFGLSTGLAVVAASGGVLPYTYVWSNGTIGPVNANLAAGVYTVTATDLLGATGTLSVTIDQPAQLLVDVDAQVNITCLNTTGSATLDVSGGTGTPSILWSNGQIGLTASNLGVGLYTAVVTDQNGCTSVETVTITADVALPSVQIDAGLGVDLQIDCLTPQITIDATATASGPLNFLWTTVNGHIVAGVNTPEVTVDAAGTYTLVVTNSLTGCTNSASVNVTANLTLPAVNIEAGVGVDLQIDCQSSQLVLSGSGSATGSGILYLWTTVDGHIVAGGNTLNATVDAAGTYVLTVLNTNNGCSSSESVTVTANLELPAVGIDVGAGVDLQLDCLSPQLTINATASGTGNNLAYLWTTVNGHIVSGGNTLNVVVDAAGTYTLLVTNNLNGCSATASVTVTADVQLPTASATVSGQLGCSTSALTINGSASSQGSNFIYLWTTLNGNIVSGHTTLTPTVNLAGTYTLLVTNTSNGCTATTSVTVTGTPGLQVSLSGQVNVTCFGLLNGSATVAATGGTGGYTYLWSNGMTTASVSGLAAGVYTVTVADAQNCQAVVTVTIGQPAQLTATTSSTATSGGNNNGAAAVTVSGGTAPYTYSWSNGMTGSSISGLAPGSYTVTVTDANGCTLNVTVVVGNGSNCTLTVAVTGNNAACGQTNGSAAAVAANGSGTVTYSWSNGMAGATITGLGVGVYVVTATDANGCTAVGAAQITSVDNTPPTVVTQNATVVLDANGQGTLTAAMVNNGSSDACGNVTISINIPSFDCGDIGTHTVVLTVTDQSGNAATGTAQVTVVDNTPPTLTCPANVSVTGSSIATYNLPSLTDNCSTDNLSVILLNGMPSGSIFPQGSTTVTYGVLGLGGILTTCTFTVTVTTSIVVSFDIDPPSCPGAADGSITAIATGGAAPYSYFWVGSGQTTATATGLSAGVHQVVIVDADGNVVVQTVTLNDPAAMNVSLVFVVDDCDGEGSIDVTVTGGTGPYTFVWTDANGNVVGNTEDLNNVPSGQYTLMITDANGCTFTTGIITVDFTTGVVESELETAGQVQAFPNPTATGVVTFKVTFAETTPVVAEVYNALGQLLATLPQADMRQGQFELNLAAFQPGHYQVKLVTDEGIYTKKVIYLE